jgi:hypothetical protein
MSIVPPVIFPSATNMYGSYGTILAVCIYYDGINTPVTFSVIVANEEVFLQRQEELLYLPTITIHHSLYDVFQVLSIDYYGMDIISDPLLNHIIYSILSTPLQMLVPCIAMNIYSYYVVVYSLQYGGIVTENEKKICHETIEQDHVSADVAFSALDI